MGWRGLFVATFSWAAVMSVVGCQVAPQSWASLAVIIDTNVGGDSRQSLQELDEINRAVIGAAASQEFVGASIQYYQTNEGIPRPLCSTNFRLSLIVRDVPDTLSNERELRELLMACTEAALPTASPTRDRAGAIVAAVRGMRQEGPKRIVLYSDLAGARFDRDTFEGENLNGVEVFLVYTLPQTRPDLEALDATINELRGALNQSGAELAVVANYGVDASELGRLLSEGAESVRRRE